MQKVFSTGGKIFLAICLIATGGFGSFALAETPGSVLITEFMANPTGTDSDREWIEVKNLSGGDVNLNGWKITDTANHPVSGDYIIPNNGLAVICRNSSSTANGGVVCDYQANMSLANSGDRTIAIKDENDNTIDSIAYSSAMESHSTFLSGGIWYFDKTNTYGDGDYGTPGLINNVITPVDDQSGTLVGEVEFEVYDLIVSTNQNAVDISLKINATGTVELNYGETINYGLSDQTTTSQINEEIIFSFSGLTCGNTYFYEIIAATEIGDSVTINGSFATQTCTDLEIDSITQTKTNARANNSYTDGWEWEFVVSAYNDLENALQMKFGSWDNGSGQNIETAGNMRFSIDNGVTWQDISETGIYSGEITIAGIDDDLIKSGRQIPITVQMKVPVGSGAGSYGADYGIRIE